MADIEKILYKVSIREKIFLVWAIIATLLLVVFILLGIKVILTWQYAIVFSIALLCGVIVWAVKTLSSKSFESNKINAAIEHTRQVVRDINGIQLCKPVQWRQIHGKEELLLFFENDRWYAWYDFLSPTFKVREAQRLTLSQVEDKLQRDKIIQSFMEQGRLSKTAAAKLGEIIPQPQVIKDEENET